MKGKKTISVERIKEYANYQLGNKDLLASEKEGIIIMLEKILHMSNSYKGFMFNSSGDVAFKSDDYVNRKYF